MASAPIVPAAKKLRREITCYLLYVPLAHDIRDREALAQKCSDPQRDAPGCYVRTFHFVESAASLSW